MLIHISYEAEEPLDSNAQWARVVFRCMISFQAVTSSLTSTRILVPKLWHSSLQTTYQPSSWPNMQCIKTYSLACVTKPLKVLSYSFLPRCTQATGNPYGMGFAKSFQFAPIFPQIYNQFRRSSHFKPDSLLHHHPGRPLYSPPYPQCQEPEAPSPFHAQ